MYKEINSRSVQRLNPQQCKRDRLAIVVGVISEI